MKLFSDLCQYVIEQDRISKKRTEKHWQSLPYEIEDVKGEMLLAGECTAPEPITLRLNVKGWYKIFLCFINMRSDNYVYFKLTDDTAYHGIRNYTQNSPHTWCTTEFAHEVYWKCADMTGQDLIIDKPHDTKENVACVAWVKLIPMTEDEVTEYQNIKNDKDNRCVHFHTDTDRNYEDSIDSDEALLNQEGQLGGTDIGECSVEIPLDFDGIFDLDHVQLLDGRGRRYDRKYFQFYKKTDEVYPKRVNLLHRSDIKAYAAIRMSMCSFHAPLDIKSYKMHFAEEHPECYCIMRDKSVVNVCSYAYPEVRKHVIDWCRKSMSYGFDGVTLMFIRGLHIAFEPPVIKRFNELYPDIDPFTLPMKDERLNGVWCEFMTQFMRELKAALPDIRINVLLGYSPETALNEGLDVKTWAKEGLIDSVLQGHMMTYEDLDGCLRKDETIDLEKYNRLIRTKQIIRRKFDNDFEFTLEGAKKYLEICKEYDIDFSAAITWPRNIPYEKYPYYANELREIGVKKFFCLNANQIIWNLPEFHMASSLGHDSKIEAELSHYYKVNSIDNVNISAFNPNWRG